MTVRWGWPVLLAALLVIGLLLAWADSTVFRPLFPEPFPQVRRPPFRAAPAAVPLPPIGPRRVFFSGLGPAGGLYTFWWFVSLGAGLILVSLAPLVVAPSRARRAAQRVSAASLPLMLAAGIATVLLALAATVLLRIGFVLLAIVPLVWALGALGALVGLAALALAGGRRLSTRLGPAGRGPGCAARPAGRQPGPGAGLGRPRPGRGDGARRLGADEAGLAGRLEPRGTELVGRDRV